MSIIYTAGEVRKAGETDVSHKDYVLSWGPGYLKRSETINTPDLFTAFGVDRQSGKTVRLPTTEWPFDHTAVMASFLKPGKANKLGILTRFFGEAEPRRKGSDCCWYVGDCCQAIVHVLHSLERLRYQSVPIDVYS